MISVPLSNQPAHFIISAHRIKNCPITGAPLKKAIQPQLDDEYEFYSLDWRPYSNNSLICSANADNTGKVTTRRIASETQVKSIHAIRQSCGSFLTFGFCNTIKTIRSEIKLQTTYLDPGPIYAGIFWNYGLQHLESCVDFGDTRIDSSNTVAGSKTFLGHTFTFDVTQFRINQNSKEPAHNWPLKYYIEAYKNMRRYF